MKKLADDLYMLTGFPPNAINVYVAGDVLVDAGTRQAERRILRQIQGMHITAHALTHVHPDHQGSSHAVCLRLSIPLWCPEHEVAAMETPGAVTAEKIPSWLRSFQERWWVGPPHLVDRALAEGDEVAGFTVIDTPGHSRGHISFWRESDRVLIAGDALANMNTLTGVPGLCEPPDVYTTDPVQNRKSIRKLAELEPQLIVFGHGAPLRKPEKLKKLVAALPQE